MHYRITTSPSKHGHQSSKSSKHKRVTYEPRIDIVRSRRKRCSCDECRHRDSHRYHGDRKHRRHYEHRHNTRSRRFKYPSNDDYMSPDDLIASHLRDIEKNHYRKGPRRNEWSTMSLFNTRSFRHPSYNTVYPSYKSYHPQTSIHRYPYSPPYSRSQVLRDDYDQEASDEYTERIFEHFLNQRPRDYEAIAYPEYESYSSDWDTDASPSKSECDWSYYGNPWSEGLSNLPIVPEKLINSKGKNYSWSSSHY